MLSPSQRLQPRSADIASKVMDGEAIIINLANGVYYSLDKAGGLAWEQIMAMRPVTAIVAAVTARYDVPTASEKVRKSELPFCPFQSRPGVALLMRMRPICCLD